MKAIVTHTNANVIVAKNCIEEAGGIALESGYDTIRFYVSTNNLITRYCYSYAMATGQTIQQNDVTVENQDFKGWVFYAEYSTKQDKNKDVAHSPQRGIEVLQHTTGNVIAVFPEQKDSNYNMTGIGCLMIESIPNDDKLAWSSLSHSYLEEYGKRISLEQALRLHPNMFLQGYFEKEQ